MSQGVLPVAFRGNFQPFCSRGELTNDHSLQAGRPIAHQAGLLRCLIQNAGRRQCQEIGVEGDEEPLAGLAWPRPRAWRIARPREEESAPAAG
jgi:hypothetical protein